LEYANHGPSGGRQRSFGTTQLEKTRIEAHLLRPFKLSNDPLFAEKVEDIVGPYLNPPEHALVLSVDEKSQVQALDRTQPGDCR
jgi:hypothetical protein